MVQDFQDLQKESPIWKSVKPTTAQISPACTSLTFFLPNPSNTYNSLTFSFYNLSLLPVTKTNPLTFFFKTFSYNFTNLPILPKNEEVIPKDTICILQGYLLLLLGSGT